MDNVTANAGAGGATFGTDDVAGVHYPRSKMVWGPDGTVNDADDADGKRLPVKSVGGAAQDAAIAGNPVPVGHRASNAVPTEMSADGDVVYPWALRNGARASSLVPHTAGGLTPSKTISAASTNATSVKASAGKLYGIFAHNINAAVRYLKLYNKASAPTVGTDTPVLTLPIPANTAGAGFVFNSDVGIEFATGIASALTTGVADADTGAVAANEIVVNLLYK